MKLGRDKLIIKLLINISKNKLGSDQFSWAIGSDKLKSIYSGPFLIFLIIFHPKLALKKTDGSWFFGPDFCLFYRFWGLYGFIEKQAPQKALCLGPDPPLGNL
jgi:hypothetical protein